MTFSLSALCLVAAPVGLQAGSPFPPSLGYDLGLAPGERLLGYRWDGGSHVPFLADDSHVRLEFGEHGLDPAARLYLPAHALDESAASGAATLASQGLALDEAGRHGRALRFGPSSFLRLGLAPASGELGWSASLWVRPEASVFGRVLLVAAGSFEVAVLPDGRVRASLLPSGERVTSTSALRAGAWSFVQLAHDPRISRQLRLFVDGDAQRSVLAPGAPDRVPAELQLGDLLRTGNGPSFLVDELSLDARATSTAQALARWQRAPEAGAHLLEMLTTRGLRSATPAAGASAQLVLDLDADFGRGALRGAVAASDRLRWAPARWLDLDPGLAPPPRTTHPLVALDGRRLLTFGGETRDTHLGPMVNTDDTWVFDGARNTWARVPTTRAPAPRCHVPAAYSPDHQLVLLVGGWKNDVQPNATYADTWVFDVRAGDWEQRVPAGDPIGPGSDYGLVYLPARASFLLLHGNQNALYDPSANTWRRLPPARAVTEGGAPTNFSVGASTMCVTLPASGEVVVFGGSSGPNQTIFSDTTALYDVGTNTYTVLATPVRPSARVRSGFAYDARRGLCVLFGGVQDQFSQRHDDLWVFDPRSRTWREVACSGRPGPRGGYYGMAYDAPADRFVLYGGRSAPERWLDDTLALEFDLQRSGRALYTFDRGGPGGANAWFADTTAPGSSRVTFLFRGADVNGQWNGWRTSTAGLDAQRYLQVVAFLQPGLAGEEPSIERMGLR
jgi:hypothetical protein